VIAQVDVEPVLNVILVCVFRKLAMQRTARNLVKEEKVKKLMTQLEMVGMLQLVSAFYLFQPVYAE